MTLARCGVLLAALACIAATKPSPLDRPMPAAERGGELVAALSAAGPGAVIELGAGTYTAPPTGFRISQKPNVTLRAAPGAHVVLTLRDPRFHASNTLWSPVEGAPGTYRIGEVLGSSIYRDDGRKVMYGRDRAHFDLLVSEGVPAAYRGAAETLLYLGGDDPRTTPLWVSFTDAAVLACEGSPGLRLEGLDVRFGGAVGINFGAGCDGSVLDGLTVFGGRDGVRVKNGLSSRVTVLRCWIVNSIDRRWRYRDAKGNVIYEGSAVSIPGVGHVVEESVLEGWFNGIQTFAFGGVATIDPVIRGTLIQDILDDAVELDGVTVRGEVAETLILDALICFSFSPRQVRAPGEYTRVHHSRCQATRDVQNDRDGTVGHAQGTKFNSHPIVAGVPTAATDLLFERNTFYCAAECWRGAPTGQQAYPSRTRARGNVFVSRGGPIMRHTGGPEDGNEFEGNAYWLEGPGLFAENWGTRYNGTRIAYQTLEAARSSAPGVAARWEATGVYADPLLARPGEPSSLRAGSPAEGRGAFERAPLRVDEIVRLPTGWILARGAGFESAAPVPGLSDAVIVSSGLAFARALSPQPAPPRILSVDVAP